MPMVHPNLSPMAMEKVKETECAVAASGQSPPSKCPTTTNDTKTLTSVSKGCSYVKNMVTSAPPSQAAAANASSGGLDLLCAASQVNAKLNDEESEAAAAAAHSSSTTVSNDNGTATEVESSSSNTTKADTVSTSSLKSFPQVLQEILARPDYQSIAHWLPDGLSFIIADKQRFVDEILPTYFREALFNSFIRKLNRWGFRRIKSSRKGEESSFAHTNFVRDKPWLCSKMRCKSKPTDRKISAAKNKKKRIKTKAQKSTTEAAKTTSDNRLANLSAPSFAAPVQAIPPIMERSGFGSVHSSVAIAEHEPLPISTASIFGAAASNARDRQFLPYTPNGYEHDQRLFRENERLILLAQIHQRQQIELQLQRLNEMANYNAIQSAMSMRAQHPRDNNHRNNYGDKGERK